MGSPAEPACDFFVDRNSWNRRANSFWQNRMFGGRLGDRDALYLAEYSIRITTWPPAWYRLVDVVCGGVLLGLRHSAFDRPACDWTSRLESIRMAKANGTIRPTELGGDADALARLQILDCCCHSRCGHILHSERSGCSRPDCPLVNNNIATDRRKSDDGIWNKLEQRTSGSLGNNPRSID